MTKSKGFTLIELLIFVIILAIIISILRTAISFALKYAPVTHNQTVATAAADGCMGYLLGQRNLNGYNFNSQTCPGATDYTTVPSFCTNITPSNFTTTIKISCATVSGFTGTQAFKKIEVTTASGSTKTILTQLIADY